MREGQLIFERRHHLTRNLGIWPFVNGWEANFYVVCDREYAGHSLRRLFGFVFIYVAGHKPSQGDNTIFYGDGYVGRLEIGIPSEFSLHVSFDFTIGFHGLTPQLLAPSSTFLPNQGGLAQRAGAAKRGSISRACSAIAISAEPPNTILMPTSSPSAQAAVPGRPVRMIVAKIRSMMPLASIQPHCPDSSRLCNLFGEPVDPMYLGRPIQPRKPLSEFP